MAKKVPPHLATRAKKCIFCGEPGLSRTHVWPDWVNEMFPGETREVLDVLIDHRAPGVDVTTPIAETKQGNLFTQKPYLACEPCNTGWMKQLEDEVSNFLRPILTGEGGIELTEQQAITLAAWAMLITILAEYTLKGPNAISPRERDYLMKRGHPPGNWAIFLAGLDGPFWSKAWYHHTLRFKMAESVEQAIKFDYPLPNTQITSLGMGKLFIQLFSSVNLPTVSDYEVHARVKKMVQLWPRKSRLWPLPRRKTKLPTKLTLSDNEADVVAHAFYARLQILYGGVVPEVATTPLPPPGRKRRK